MLSGKVYEVRRGKVGGDIHIGQRLKGIRERAGLTQTQLAERLGVKQSALSRLERQSDIRVSTLRGYIEALGARLRIDATFEQAALRISSIDEVFEYPTSDDQLVLPILGEDHYVPRRDVVFSIRPQYCDRILDGSKTVELRRRFPLDVPPGTVALIYATTPVRALTGMANITGVIKKSPAEVWEQFGTQACIAKDDFDAYFSGLDSAFAIQLRNAKPLRRALDLTELRERFSFEPPQSFLYAKPELRQALSYECAEVPN